MRILPCGPAARLLETADPVPLALGLRAAAQRDEIPAIIDLVVAEATVLIRCVSDISDRALARVQPMPFTPADGDLVNIPVIYDGPDLAEVARHAGVTADDVIHIHAGTTYRAEFCGFAPGFVYLSGIDPRLHLPRRHTPRTRVPAGSIALAAGYTAVYPLSTPGGWHLLGHTNIAIFDPQRDEPSLLRAGMRVRFHPVDSLPEPFLPAVAALCDADDAVAEVLAPGPLALIQDLGRPGHGESAVGASGAFDRRAHRLANRIVGNSETAATLEALGSGLTLRAIEHVVVAVTGAHGPVWRDENPMDRGTPIALAPGQVLRLGAPGEGVRSMVALRGGVAAAVTLGSRSRDTLAGLGPDPLTVGDLLCRHGTASLMNVDHIAEESIPAILTVRVHPGPRRDWFTPRAQSLLVDSAYTVAPDSDRIGIRLRGGELDLVEPHRRLASEGVVRGAIQVPPDGQPVVLGPDHPVTGGYPVIGIVDDCDVDALGQSRPGTHVRFRGVGW